MENAEKILIIILATVLTVFLVVCVVAITKLVQLLDHLKRISEKAEKLANSAEHVGQYFKYAAGPAAIGKILVNISSAVLKKKRSRSKDDDK